MKTLPPGLAAHVAGQATTLATCWILTRLDGVVLGFTDHDRPILLDGVSCEAASGLRASEDVAQAGLAVGGVEVAGALASAAVTAADIAAGLYDGARIDVHLVNWSDVSERLHLRSGTIGEVVAAEGAFRAELRSAALALDEERGRLFQHRCDADLGDARCRVDLAAPTRRGLGTVLSGSDRRTLRLSGLAAFAPALFERGRLQVTSGVLAGRASEVKSHVLSASVAEVELWQALPAAPAPGDVVSVTAGCEKLFATCRDRFANAENFRGFPHLPGPDFVLAHPSRSRHENDGSAVVP
ncbi:DUF2163 domain-containing protein [Prosthecomicrobium sp. N25]|uniref:DUF2163 domain-containing protein n=1 Tax=Prosthecomicrobium sp. N25 TaxID=3129254 RepID=UPI0030785E05